MNRYGLLVLLVVGVFFAGVSNGHAAPVTLVGPGVISVGVAEDFTGLNGGGAGHNYDGILGLNGASVAERFVGQTLSFVITDNDKLSGTPSGTLALQIGDSNDNVGVLDQAGDEVLYGLGNLGFPVLDAVGEGAIAILFNTDQIEFGLDIFGGDGGNAYIDFWARDGSILSSHTLSGLAIGYVSYEFQGGAYEIAGVSIWNDDPAGIGFDNLKYSAVPEPSSLLLLGTGLIGLAGFRRKFRS